MLKVSVFSNVEFNSIMQANHWDDDNLPDDIAFISICDPGYEEPELGLFHWFKKDSDSVINLDFYDIESYFLPGNGKVRVNGLSDEQAESLLNFIEKNLGKNFYIHCAAGVSRSQGVAKFITDIYNELYPKSSLREDNPCYFPNPHVVSVLKHLWYEKHPDKDLSSIFK